MPPSGAWNAAATPAAAPMPTQPRCDEGMRSSYRPCIQLTFTLEMREATAAPMCTIGPSLPSGSPEPTTSVVPTILATSTRKLR